MKPPFPSQLPSHLVWHVHSLLVVPNCLFGTFPRNLCDDSADRYFQYEIFALGSVLEISSAIVTYLPNS
jgi:hypothetical protein